MDLCTRIGRFITDPDVARANRRARIDEMAALPGAVRGAVPQLPSWFLQRYSPHGRHHTGPINLVR